VSADVQQDICLIHHLIKEFNDISFTGAVKHLTGYRIKNMTMIMMVSGEEVTIWKEAASLINKFTPRRDPSCGRRHNPNYISTRLRSH
jgi:hypothetical protein